MRILFESGLYSNADSIQDFTVSLKKNKSDTEGRGGKNTKILTTWFMDDPIVLGGGKRDLVVVLCALFWSKSAEKTVPFSSLHDFPQT